MMTTFSDKRFGEPSWIWMYIVAAAGFSVFRNASFLILTGKSAVFWIVSLCVVIFRTVTPCNVNFSFVLIFVALINLGYVNACTVSLQHEAVDCKLPLSFL